MDAFDARGEDLFLALARAEDMVSRVDARAQICAFAEGWAARVDFSEANGWGWVSGEIVDMEDLVLHDAQMDARLPDQALRAAHGVVRARRKARRAGAELQSVEGAAWLAGRRSEAPLGSGAPADSVTATSDGEARDLASELAHRLRTLSRGETADPEDAIAEWVDWTRRLPDRAPALLRAAAAIEGWRLVNPLPRQSYVGGILVAQALRLSGRTRSCLLGFEAARRLHLQPPRGFLASAPVRLAYWLKIMTVSAEAGLAEMRRMELARQVVLKGIGGRRSHDRSAELLDLLLANPLVSAAMVSERLGIATHSARRLLAGLGASVIEISGRSRYRAWRL